MPELPEVECVRLSLERLVVGRRVRAVRVSRADVVNGPTGEEALLAGEKVSKIIRHGKQLAIVGSRRCVAVHLGMSGQLCLVEARPPSTQAVKRLGRPNSSLADTDLPPHTHVVWALEGGIRLRFTDPRRFGGLWTFGSEDDLVFERWSKLGPDALTIKPGQLARRLSRTTRGLKAALLDQHLIAGLGNIYVDELLFSARLHPLLPANALGSKQTPGLVRRMRALLTGAIKRGGSSLRDYVDAENQRGSQQTRHRVYGRSGQRCKRRACHGRVSSEQVAGRTTAWCPECQKLA